MTSKSSVSVECLDGIPAIRMNWEKQVNNRDVAEAFEIINNLLNESVHSLYVIVDLQSNPNMPVAATLNGALFGPYRNPRLKKWLIIGASSLGRVVENILSSVTGRHNVQWFDDSDAVFAYLEQATRQE